MSELITAQTDIIRRQETQLRQMESAVQQLASIAAIMDARIRELEKRIGTQTVDSKQARALQYLVRKRSEALCEKHGFDYAESGPAFRRAMWADLKTQYRIDDVHDLPERQYDQAAEFISGWSSYSLVKKLRRRKDG